MCSECIKQVEQLITLNIQQKLNKIFGWICYPDTTEYTADISYFATRNLFSSYIQ